MTTVAVLLTQKQQLVRRLQEELEPQERDEIERRLDKINMELNRIDRAPRETRDEPS
jgi:hypothetical protein